MLSPFSEEAVSCLLIAPAGDPEGPLSGPSWRQNRRVDIEAGEVEGYWTGGALIGVIISP